MTNQKEHLAPGAVIGDISRRAVVAVQQISDSRKIGFKGIGAAIAAGFGCILGKEPDALQFFLRVIAAAAPHIGFRQQGQVSQIGHLTGSNDFPRRPPYALPW